MSRFLSAVIVCAGVLFVNGFAITKIAGVGDSNTDGSALPTAGETGDTVNVWPAFLAKKLGNQYQVGNFGLGGTTILRNGDYPYVNNTPFTSVFAFKPDIVIINLGTNDAKPFNYVYVNQLANDLEYMIDSFLTMTPKPSIYLCTPIPVCQDNADYEINNANLVAGVIPAIKSVAHKRSLPLISLYDSLSSHLADGSCNTFYLDGVHVTAGGQDSVARIINNALQTHPTSVIPSVSGVHRMGSGRASIGFPGWSSRHVVDITGRRIPSIHAREDAFSSGPLGVYLLLGQ